MLLLVHAALAADLSLADALATLRADNPDLAQARARVAQARAAVGQVRGGLLPTLVASGGYTRNDDEAVLDFADLLDQIPLDIETPDPVTIQPLDSWSGSATLTVPLVVPSAWGQLGAATAGVDAARAATTNAELTLQTAVVRAAAAQALDEGIVAAARQALQAAEAHATAADRAVAAGTAPPLSATQAATEVLRRQSELAQAEADLAQAERAMGTLLGRAEPVHVALPPVDAPDGDAAPELLAAEAQARAATARHTAAALAYAPVLAASATGTASTAEFITGENTAWRVGVNLSWTLFDGGAREARLADAAAAATMADASVTATRLRVAQAREDAAAALTVARTRLDLARRQATLAADASAIAQRGFAAGTVPSLDVIDAAQRAFDADVGVARAEAAVILASAELRRARGVPW